MCGGQPFRLTFFEPISTQLFRISVKKYSGNDWKRRPSLSTLLFLAAVAMSEMGWREMITQGQGSRRPYAAATRLLPSSGEM